MLHSSTQVWLPKFQYEIPYDGDILKRSLRWRAEPRQWVEEDELASIKGIGTVTSKIREDVISDWWGVHHRTETTTSVGQLFKVPFDEDPLRLFVKKSIKHNYLWDEQAVEGVAFETVLSRLSMGGFKDVAAFLEVPQGRIADTERTSPVQRFVVLQNDEWVEPRYGEIDDVRDFYLLLLGELAVANLDDLVATVATSGN